MKSDNDMKLADFLGYSIYKTLGSHNDPTDDYYENNAHGIIYRLCEFDHFCDLPQAGSLEKIFYPGGVMEWDEERPPYIADDFHYMLRSSEKPVQRKWIPMAEYLYNDVSGYVAPYPSEYGSNARLKYVIHRILSTLYTEKIDNWNRIYEYLREPYKPFTNYAFDEEMVNNERTGTDRSTNASTSSATNKSEASESVNENSSEDSSSRRTETSSDATSDESTTETSVKGYNSNNYVDQQKVTTVSSGEGESEGTSVTETSSGYSGRTGTNSSDQSESASESEGTADRIYAEYKTYLLRRSGADNVDFQEWLQREIEMRRRTFIEDVIFQDLDDFFCRGVY